MNRMAIRLLLVLSVLILASCETVNQNIQTTEQTETNKELSINIQHRTSEQKVTSSDNNTRLGAGYLAKKNYERAMLKLQKAIKLNSENAKAYNYLGILYWQLEQPKLAERNFVKSHQLSPLDAAINHNYASFLCSQKQYKEADKFFIKVFSNPLYDKLANAYQLSGDCDLETLQLDKAEKKYKKALKLDKKNILALLGMAKIYYKRNNLKIAQYYFDRYEQKTNHTPDSLWLGINIQRKLGDNNKLASYILELKNLYPDSNETLYYIEGKQSY